MKVSIVRYVVGWLAAGLLLVGAGVLVGVFLAERPSAEAAALALRNERIVHQQYRSDFDAQLSSLRSKLDQANGELMIERATRSELEKSLAGMQGELGQLKDQLAFFEQLLPPGPQGSVALRAVDLERQGNALSYRVLLMRSGKPGEKFTGILQFVATGKQGDQEVPSLLLKTLQITIPGKEASESEDLKLEFEQFQRSQGLLALPEGFEPAAVTVRVLSGDIVLASRRVDL